jgi:hypothetical protein
MHIIDFDVKTDLDAQYRNAIFKVNVIVQNATKTEVIPVKVGLRKVEIKLMYVG